MANVLIPTVRGEMPAYVAAPPSIGRVPGVVVLHDVGGMGQDLRNQADWLAAAGFLAEAAAYLNSVFQFDYGKCNFFNQIGCDALEF